jgi:hypothetical protein
VAQASWVRAISRSKRVSAARGLGLALAGAVVAVLCSLPHRDGPSSSTGLKTRGDLAHAGGRMLNLLRFLGFVALLDKVFPNGCGYPPR